MSVWVVVWVVLMMFWLFTGCYTNWDANNPKNMSNTLIPWLCVLILGLIIFGGISSGTGMRY